MEVNYKLDAVRELASGDEDFIEAIVSAFVEEVPEAVQMIKEGLAKKDFKQVYQNAHKIKPTIQMFDIAIYDEVIVLQDWGKFEEKGKNVSAEFDKVSTVVSKVVKELHTDFNL